MNTLLRKPVGIFALLVMVLTMLAFPQASLAKVFLSGGGLPGSPGSSEGDPLDSNDYSGGGGDDDVHQRRIIPRDSDIIIFGTSASVYSIMLRVDFLDGVPVFTFLTVKILDLQAEASHVR